MHSHFSLSWNSFKTSICNGFSTLQQNGEFVDMTIAAEGHFVKVHQMILALASPYLKELITSAPCQHPVVFLNNVSHKVLCLLLEYMYTGEAVVPADCLSSFADTAKSLHIRGLESINTGGIPTRLGTGMPLLDESILGADSGLKIITSSDKLNDMALPSNASKIFIKRGPSMSNTEVDELHDYQDQDDLHMNDSDDDIGVKKERNSNKYVHSSQKKPTSKVQFTVSIRGSLQLILNRYMYNLNSTTRSGHRRWRCVDYRNNKCAAYVTTRGNVVINRANLHNHSFHDKKILSKIEKKAVYSAIEEAENYKDSEQNDKSSEDNELSIEKDSFLSLEELGNSITKSDTDMNMKES